MPPEYSYIYELLTKHKHYHGAVPYLLQAWTWESRQVGTCSPFQLVCISCPDYPFWQTQQQVVIIGTPNVGFMDKNDAYMVHIVPPVSLLDKIHMYMVTYTDFWIRTTYTWYVLFHHASIYHSFPDQGIIKRDSIYSCYW